MRFFIKVNLEGLPLYLWSESFAVVVIGRSYSLYSVAERSRRREATDLFELTAWTVDPTAIPLRVWLTVTYRDLSGMGSPQVIVHRQRHRQSYVHGVGGANAPLKTRISLWNSAEQYEHCHYSASVHPLPPP
jgi:hypothetical protein